MSDNNVATNIKPLPLHSMIAGQARIAGKVISARRVESNYYTVVISPARDEYSHPKKFELRSKDKLAPVGDEINVLCELGGSVREFKYRDKNTGEDRTGHDARTYLEVIE